jgi:large subunit ribosomal protein L39e
MMGKKSETKKKRLAKAGRQNRRMPIFVTVRTKRKVVWNSRKREWRTQKLRISEE